MNRYLTKFSLVVLTLLTTLSADEGSSTEPRIAMKTNAQLIYNDKAPVVEDILELFTEGKFYGRLRSNNFHFNWNAQNETHDIHTIAGVGTSLVYQSATWNMFDFRVGVYGSYAFFQDKNDPASSLKAGKDVVSRYDVINGGNRYMAVIGQSQLRYGDVKYAEVLAGRQLVETFYTKSNDTKMIPNTFDGLVINSKAIPKTAMSVAYLAQQKLRDHTTAHSVLMFGDSASDPDAATATYEYAGKPVTVSSSKYSENDDAGMHKGLTYTALSAAGKPTDSPLITGDVHNKSVENLKLDGSFYVVPELLSQVMLEGNYKFKVNEKLSISPGMRYINQMDSGAGSVGGASLSGNTLGYENKDSLNAQMIGARLVTQYENYKLNLGYTQILDEADLVTPWRGFPTSGYTRSMARYNWKANTQSARIQLERNANKSGVYKDLYIQTSILLNNGDESKNVPNSLYYYAGFVQNIPSMVEMQWRLRLGYAQYLSNGATVNFEDFNNLDARLELNYFF